MKRKLEKQKYRIFKKSNLKAIEDFINNSNSDYIEIMYLDRQRSENFKRWYFGELRCHLEELGYLNYNLMTASEINLIVNKTHDLLKEKFIADKNIEFGGLEFKIRPTTNDLNTEEFEDFANKSLNFLKKITKIDLNNI